MQRMAFLIACKEIWKRSFLNFVEDTVVHEPNPLEKWSTHRGSAGRKVKAKRSRLRGGISRAPKKVTLRGIVAQNIWSEHKGILGNHSQ